MKLDVKIIFSKDMKKQYIYNKVFDVIESEHDTFESARDEMFRYIQAYQMGMSIEEYKELNKAE